MKPEPDPNQTVIETAAQPVLKRRAARSTKAVVWTRYRAVDPYPCDFCKLNQVDDPHAPYARRARYRRRARVNGAGYDEDLYLCLEHTNDQRVMDRLPKFRS